MAAEWKKRLQQPSFRGVPFFVNESDTTFGRRYQIHEYPQHDIPFAEDMGRKARVFNVDCYVVGDDWESSRDRLIEACEKPGPGRLVHPEFGEVSVVCQTVKVSESKQNAARYTSFEINFVEAGDNEFPSSNINTSDMIGILADKGIKDIITYFIDNYNLNQVPQFIRNSVDTYRNAVHAEIIKYAPSVESDVATLKTADISSAIAFSTEVNNAIRAVCELSDKTLALKTMEQLHSINPETITGTTSTRTRQKAILAQTEGLIKQLAAVESTRLTIGFDYKSYDEAIAIKTAIGSRLSSLIETAATNNNDDAYTALRNSRAAFYNDISVRAPNLSHIIIKTFTDSQPALVAAYEQYEDANRDLEIVDRNRIRHPGFTPLELEFLDV